MAFALVTDTSANLPAAYLQQHDVQAIPYAYYIDDVEHFCPGPDEFDGAAYYQMLTDGGVVKTTLINAQRYEDFFRPYLEAGQDLLYVGMSSGISSSLNMATLAAHDLLEEFPERKLVVFDAMTASLGEGIFVRAAIRGDDGRDVPMLAMGPICIAPEYKRQGYGKRLLDYSLGQAAEYGAKAVCFEGNIDFYGKSGFVVASSKGVRYHGLPEGADDSFFLCRELVPDALASVRGEYAPPRCYFVVEENPDAFERYEKTFPPKEKLTLPGQIF